jgi:protein SCO1/2
MTRTLVNCIAVSMMLITAAAVTGQQSRASDSSIGIDQRLNEKIPLELAFRDEDGKAVTLREYFGTKPVILVLAYYRCPRLCSLVLNGLVDGLRRIDYKIGDQFTIVTVSIDPREGSELAAAKKTAYVEQYGRPGAAAGWHFLTGDEQEIKRLAAAVGYRYVYDAERDQFGHDSGIMILTPDGTLSRYFYGIEFPPAALRYGLEDSSEGKIGSPIARPIRLLCFAYDPATGKYTLLTMRLLRAGAVLTILAICGFWLWSWRRWWRDTALAEASGMAGHSPPAPLPGGKRGEQLRGLGDVR